MYDQRPAGPRSASTRARLLSVATAVLTLVSGIYPADLRAQEPAISSLPFNPSIIRNVSGLSEKVELTTNSSRILTLDMKIPRVQVNNPDLVKVTPLSDREIQVFAQKAGVTQINVWDEQGQIHSIDVLIYGDARELEHALGVQFPHSSIRVYRYSESLVLKGFVDRPDYVSQIIRLAEDYAPKVINNITVGGVQQVLLKVKVMEVSRTKLRDLGVDWAVLDGSSILAASNVSGLLSSTGSIISDGGGLAKVGGPIGSGGQTFQFGVFNGDTAFMSFLNALQECRAAKTLAEPNMVAVSGRPAQFQVGGEFPVLVPQSLGTTSIEFKPYGTQVDFLPIVLGNGNIRLEVRPRISDIDPSLSVNLNGSQIPALTVRQIDTAVELKAGQTFALGGLIQIRSDSLSAGLPYISDVPILGVPFRRTRERLNEIELLIFVTPEFVDAMDPCEVPCGGPGMETVSPSNEALYCGAHLEVPAYCNPIRGPYSCGEPGCEGCSTCSPGMGHHGMSGGHAVIEGDVHLPGGTGFDYGEVVEPLPARPDATHGELNLPPAEVVPPAPPASNGARLRRGNPGGTAVRAGQDAGQYTAPRPYSPSRQPLYLRNANNRQISNSSQTADSTASLPAMIGPVGYDVQQ